MKRLLTKKPDSGGGIQLGIDPDLHSTGVAFIHKPTQRIDWVGVVSIPEEWTQEEAALRMGLAFGEGFYKIPVSCHDVTEVVVEGQEIYFGKTPKPESILRIGQVAGAAIGVSCQYYTLAEIYLPKPKEWKGNVPKHIHQARVLDRFGIPFYKMGGKEKYCVPEKYAAEKIPGGSRLKPSDWKHVVDAIGLASWTK